ncbi:hypothetical protein ACVILI_003448 [Mesorhizobium sp. USDA 4775]|uniref:hypothetical protein n=1 Tax=Mesorhizobium jarvisii TaxID=1777867 RepID=UPI00049A9670|nr:hypothetical protein [Mesorhizobium jarvisii]AID29566.1 hypothetical protein MCHK_1751 [Mesorhizobium huakuii 7653R]MCH4556666.1 hypothetical protein [Mesorhizobium jarvisii]
MTTITLPGQNIAAIDQMDAGIDLLRTAWLALHSRDLLDDTMTDAIANTLNDAINTLRPVREAVNSAHKAA